MQNKNTFFKDQHLIILTFIMLFFMVIQFSSCTSDYEQWKEDVKNYSEDNKIDEAEFKKLVEAAQIADGGNFDSYKSNGKIVDSKLRDFITKICKAAVWEPQKEVKSFDINFYLENSGSMNGYLDDPNTQFKNSIYSLLARLKLFVNKNKLNLYLINSTNQLIHNNATNNDIEHFKNILNPNEFRNISNGLTSQSDLNDMVQRCIQNSRNAMSVFVSDCIYSPGNSHPDAKQYLAYEKNGLFLNVSTELKIRDLAIIVLQIDANFKGKYYNRLNQEKIIGRHIKRPFYLWFIGNNVQIKSLIDSKILQDIDGGYRNIAVFEKPNAIVAPDFRIISNPKIGDFDLDGNTINNAVADNRVFSFSLYVDFSNNMQELDYFSDPYNFKISDPNFKIQTTKLNEEFKPFTHQIKLTTSNLKSENLILDVQGRLPSWVETSTSKDDISFTADTSQWSRTFGLSYLLGGVSDAFYPKSGNSTIKSINILINKQ